MLGIKWKYSLYVCSHLFDIQEMEQPVQDVSRLARCHESANHGSRYMTCRTESPGPKPAMSVSDEGAVGF